MMTRRPVERRSPGAGIFGPLNAPAYVAWIAVAVGPLWRVIAQGPAQPAIVVGAFALVAFAAALIVRAILEESAAPDFLVQAAVVLQAALAPVCVWAFGEHLQAVLLVLAAAQVAALRQRRLALGALGLADIALFVWLLERLPLAKATQVGFAYVAFQLFAALVAQAAYTAQESRRSALRANRELLATRALVAEGVRAQERLRLSRELHDVAGHKLTALKLQLALEIRTRSSPPTQALTQCLGLADELLTDIRNVVSALRQDDGTDLQTALTALDPHLPTITVRFDLDPSARVSDIRKAEALVRCAQEGLTNALRHGSATEITVMLARSEQSLTLSVEDNGTSPASGMTPAGNGLRGLQERLDEFRGAISLERRTPYGCVLRAVLPDQTEALC